MLSLPCLPFGSTRVRAGAILTRMAESSTSDAVIDSYPEYATDADQLDGAQRKLLFGMADAIVRSHLTRQPIDAVLIVGHADKALRKPVSERATFELEVSQRRASSARRALLQRVQFLACGAHYSKVLLCIDIGIGNRRPVFANAANEAQMKKNRRVEIFLAQSHLPRSHCNVR